MGLFLFIDGASFSLQIGQFSNGVPAHPRTNEVEVREEKRREECARVTENFAGRLQMSRQRGGGHLEHILERA